MLRGLPSTVPSWIEFKLAVLMCRCLHSTAPPYLTDELHRVADIDTRRRLRSASTSTLVPLMRHSTTGDRAFPAVWNSLPSIASPRRRFQAASQMIKSELFLRCFDPDCV